jgi:hypothetical protein
MAEVMLVPEASLFLAGFAGGYLPFPGLLGMVPQAPIPQGWRLASESIRAGGQWRMMPVHRLSAAGAKALGSPCFSLRKIVSVMCKKHCFIGV